MNVPGRRLLLTFFLDVVVSTFLVVGCGTGTNTTATITAADTADQILYDMTHYVTVEGVQRARVKADTAYFYQTTQTGELRHVTITFFDAHGAETSTMTAREGTYHWRTGDMEGRGNVVVVTTDGHTLKSDGMRYSQQKNEVSSDQAFVFDAPNQHIEGEGFTSDPNFRNLTAKRPRGTGGQLTLPNR